MPMIPFQSFLQKHVLRCTARTHQGKKCPKLRYTIDGRPDSRSRDCLPSGQIRVVCEPHVFDALAAGEEVFAPPAAAHVPGAAVQRTAELEDAAEGDGDDVHAELLLQEVDHRLLGLLHHNLAGRNRDHVHGQPAAALAHDGVLLVCRVEGRVHQAPVVLAEDLYLLLHQRALWVGQHCVPVDGHKRGVGVRGVQVVRAVERVHRDALWREVALKPADARQIRHRAVLHEHHVAKQQAVRRIEHDLRLAQAVLVLARALDALLLGPVPERRVVSVGAHHGLGRGGPDHARVAVEVPAGQRAVRPIFEEARAHAHGGLHDLVAHRHHHISGAHRAVLVGRLKVRGFRGHIEVTQRRVGAPDGHALALEHGFQALQLLVGRVDELLQLGAGGPRHPVREIVAHLGPVLRVPVVELVLASGLVRRETRAIRDAQHDLLERVKVVPAVHDWRARGHFPAFRCRL
mmetsp:Transcript_53221/g.154961  ORF Transcript_53221/g.154961 Transcript_53221/m.154961 type:complete len:460 (+) Transcript_53221:226-1605(+)